jgi:hypothetical protein
MLEVLESELQDLQVWRIGKTSISKFLFYRRTPAFFAELKQINMMTESTLRILLIRLLNLRRLFMVDMLLWRRWLGFCVVQGML